MTALVDACDACQVVYHSEPGSPMPSYCDRCGGALRLVKGAMQAAPAPASNVTPIGDASMSRKALLELAKRRELELRRQANAEIERLNHALGGMTRLLGCIIEQTGELSYDVATEINEMHPGRLVVVEQDGTWTARLLDDPSKPYELSLVPEKMPEHMLDREAMERDGVTDVPMVPE